MWHFLNAVKSSDVVKGINARGETSVEAEDLIVDKGGEGQVVEKIREIFPHIGVAIFSETLVVESVDLGNLARFVISSEDGDSLWVADFEGNKESNCFY
jgi:hypothetical protein